MTETMIGFEASRGSAQPAEPVPFALTFEEVVEAFCAEQAEFRALLASMGEPRGGDPQEGQKTPSGAHQGASSASHSA